MKPRLLLLMSLLTVNVLFAKSETSFLRERLPEEATTYVRIPSSTDFLFASSEKKEYKPLTKNTEYRHLLSAIKETLKNPNALNPLLQRLGVNRLNKYASYGIALLSNIEAPLEIMQVDSKIYMVTHLSFTSIDELNTFILNITDEDAITFNKNGWLANPSNAKVAVHYDVKNGRLYGYTDINFNFSNTNQDHQAFLADWIKNLPKAEKRRQPSVIEKLEKQIDPSGKGLFVGKVLTQNEKQMLSMFDSNFRMMNAYINGFAFGIGQDSEERGQLGFLADVNVDQVVKLAFPKEYYLDFKTVGDISKLFTLTLPSRENVERFIEYINADNPRQQEAYKKGMEAIKKEWGLDPLLVLEAFGPEIIFYQDEADFFPVVKIRDRKAYHKINEFLVERSSVSRKLEDHLTELVIKNNWMERLITEIAFYQKEGLTLAKIIVNKFANIPILPKLLQSNTHIYLKEEGNWLFISYLPHPLLERKHAKNSAQEWAKKQGYDPNHSLFGAAFNVKGMHKKYYHNYLTILQNFNDDLNLNFKLEKLPRFSELNIKDHNRSNIKFHLNADTVGLSVQYEQNPLEYEPYLFGLMPFSFFSSFVIPTYSEYTKHTKYTKHTNIAKDLQSAVAPNQTQRTNISDGLQRAAALKVALVEYYATYGEWPSSNEDVGFQGDVLYGQEDIVKNIKTEGNGIITITYGNKVDPQHGIIFLIGETTGRDNLSILWKCQSGSKALDRYLPEFCEPSK